MKAALLIQALTFKTRFDVVDDPLTNSLAGAADDDRDGSGHRVRGKSDCKAG